MQMLTLYLLDNLHRENVGQNMRQRRFRAYLLLDLPRSALLQSGRKQGLHQRQPQQKKQEAAAPWPVLPL